jgi:hypothetical protein
VGFGGKALTWKVFKFYEKQGVTTLIGHSPYELLMEIAWETGLDHMGEDDEDEEEDEDADD